MHIKFFCMCFAVKNILDHWISEMFSWNFHLTIKLSYCKESFIFIILDQFKTIYIAFLISFYFGIVYFINEFNQNRNNVFLKEIITFLEKIDCNNGLLYICKHKDRIKVENLSLTGLSITTLSGMVYHTGCCSHSLLLWKKWHILLASSSLVQWFPHKPKFIDYLSFSLRCYVNSVWFWLTITPYPLKITVNEKYLLVMGKLPRTGIQGTTDAYSNHIKETRLPFGLV